MNNHRYFIFGLFKLSEMKFCIIRFMYLTYVTFRVVLSFLNWTYREGNMMMLSRNSVKILCTWLFFMHILMCINVYLW